MNKLAFSALTSLLLSACPSPQPTPTPNPPTPTPTATGGDSSTGGTAATGGSQTGGSSSNPCQTFVAPTYDSAVSAKKAEHHKYTKRHFRPLIRGVGAASVAQQTSACSQWHERNVPQFDQGSVGSCTGNACDGVICSQPFTDTSRCGETFAVQAYQGGTCVDNGCSLSKC